ncbi:hypothetical protein EAI_16398 [Harpegnathos saltator]|uniref:Uncharacterized protein n=1 Tax=Harpegnathos saltator TaxID=610380 RepID=E2BZT2_HARSA|nr:hypothetical protein EAI_16398 [Harpegnathos saltator]
MPQDPGPKKRPKRYGVFNTSNQRPHRSPGRIPAAANFCVPQARTLCGLVASEADACERARTAVAADKCCRKDREGTGEVVSLST